MDELRSSLVQQPQEETVQVDKSTSQNPLKRDASTDLIFKIVMIRGGCFLWSPKNIYTGWFDSKLSPKGREEINEASALLKSENYTFDLAFCSALSRSRESLNILLNNLQLQDIEIITSWELNERHYGGLTGYSFEELSSKYGREQVNFWLNSYSKCPPEITKQHKYYDSIYDNEFYPKDVCLPKTESLEMTHKRIKNYWNKKICPYILSGRKILMVVHNGGLLALVHYLDDLEYVNYEESKIPRATPFYYKLDETLNPIYKDINITNDLERKIADVFEIFDHAGNKTVDIREIGTIIRALGCVPSEAEIQEILLATTDQKGSNNNIHLAKFLPYMVKQIFEHKYQPATPDQLFEAFKNIDVQGLGYVTKEDFVTLMMQEGEPFNEDEIDEMLSIALDPQTNRIPYEYYINQIMYEPPPEKNIYNIADIIIANQPKKTRTQSALLRAALALAEGDDDSSTLTGGTYFILNENITGK